MSTIAELLAARDELHRQASQFVRIPAVGGQPDPGALRYECNARPGYEYVGFTGGGADHVLLIFKRRGRV